MSAGDVIDALPWAIGLGAALGGVLVAFASWSRP